MSIAQPFPLADPYGNEKPAFKVELPKQDLAVRLICPECRDSQPNIEEEFSSGDLVCRGCGLVLGDKIVDTRSECTLSFSVAFSNPLLTKRRSFSSIK
jgi:transcription initiation factor TFIIB